MIPVSKSKGRGDLRQGCKSAGAGPGVISPGASNLGADASALRSRAARRATAGRQIAWTNPPPSGTHVP
jgi:hypothetical protein